MLSSNINGNLQRNIRQRTAELNKKYTDQATLRFVLLHDIKTMLSNKLGIPPYEFILLSDFDVLAAILIQYKSEKCTFFCVENHEMQNFSAKNNQSELLTTFDPNNFNAFPESEENYFFLSNSFGNEDKLISTKKMFKKLPAGFSIFQIKKIGKLSELIPYFSVKNADITYIFPQENNQNLPIILWFNFEKKSNMEFSVNVFKKLQELEKELNFEALIAIEIWLENLTT